MVSHPLEITAEKETNVMAEMAKPRKGDSTDLDQGLLPDLLGYQLRRAQFVVFSEFQKVMADLSVTPGQYGVMTLIGRNPGMTQSALARAVGVERSTMVAVIDGLEKNGFVERRPSPVDRRSYALVLSDAGMKKLADLDPMVAEHDKQVSATLSVTEKASLMELLERVCSLRREE